MTKTTITGTLLGLCGFILSLANAQVAAASQPSTAMHGPAFPMSFTTADQVLQLHKQHLTTEMQVVGLQLTTYGEFVKQYVHESRVRMFASAPTVVWVVQSAYRSGLQYAEGRQPTIAVDVYDAMDGKYYTRVVIHEYTPFQTPFPTLTPTPMGTKSPAAR